MRAIAVDLQRLLGEVDDPICGLPCRADNRHSDEVVVAPRDSTPRVGD